MSDNSVKTIKLNDEENFLFSCPESFNVGVNCVREDNPILTYGSLKHFIIYPEDLDRDTFKALISFLNENGYRFFNTKSSKNCSICHRSL